MANGLDKSAKEAMENVVASCRVPDEIMEKANAYDALLVVVKESAEVIDQILPYITQIWITESVDEYEEAQGKKIERAKAVLLRLKAEIEKRQ